MTAPDLNADYINQHLSQITTAWTVLSKAHAGVADEVGDAQRKLIECYSPAIYRYLLGAVRDVNMADELFQEFAVRFVRGDFRRANPERGRFRDFLKTALYHLVVDYQRQRGNRPISISVTAAV